MQRQIINKTLDNLHDTIQRTAITNYNPLVPISITSSRNYRRNVLSLSPIEIVNHVFNSRNEHSPSTDF